jgi:uncharacterized glyoxalase superfamily protein PhnB
VKVCRECIGWLRDRSGIVSTTPIFPVTDLVAALAFYDRAGFETRTWEGGGFAFVSYDDESVFDLDPGEGHGPSSAGCSLVVPDTSSWHDRITAAGIDATTVEDMPWGMREFQFSDPDGNYIRVSQPI